MKPAFCSSRRRAGAIVVALLGLLIAPGAVERAFAQTAPARAAAPGAVRVVLPLARLVGHDRPVRLSSVAASTQWALPIPALWQPDDVHLELAGTASIGLADTSQLELAVNGRVVQQFRLGGRQQDFRRDIAIPAELLHEGFNDVKVTVAQHYTDRCEYPMATQLWTDLDLSASRFVLAMSPRPVVPRLDRLDGLFDKAGIDATPTVGVLSSAAPRGPVLSAMGLVAQGIGQRFDYVPVRLTSGRFPPSLAALGGTLPAGARVAVVLGTVDQLGSYLAGLSIPAGAGGVVAIRPLPGDPTRAVVVLAAPKEADLPIVASAFAMRRMPWPDRDWVSIADLKMPPAASAGIAASLKPSTDAFPLSARGYATTTFSGTAPGGAALRFWNAGWQGRAQVRMHMAYGGGMSAQSVMNVLVNGTLHGSIPLDQAAGGVYDNYAVSLPTGALRTGWNTLELQPMLIPQTNGGDCKPFFPGNLALTLYDDSTLQTFGGSPLRRPDLAMPMADAQHDPAVDLGAGTAVQLTDGDDATVGAGLTLVAKLGQTSRAPLLRSRLVVGEDADATNPIWVGALDRLPQTVRQAVGLGEAGRLTLPVPLVQSIEVPVLEGGDTMRRLREAIDGAAAAPSTVGATVTVGQAPLPYGIAATAARGDRRFTVFTAATPAALQAGLHDVVDYGQWAQLRGDFALWRPGSATVHSYAADDAPFAAYSLRGGLGLWVSQYPWWALAILLAGMTLLVLLTRAVLASYRRRNLPVQGSRREDGVAS